MKIQHDYYFLLYIVTSNLWFSWTCAVDLSPNYNSLCIADIINKLTNKTVNNNQWLQHITEKTNNKPWESQKGYISTSNKIKQKHTLDLSSPNKGRKFKFDTNMMVLSTLVVLSFNLVISSLDEGISWRTPNPHFW